MARYRKVSIQIWNDKKFREFSDDAKLLFLFLLTHPSMTSVGGMRATKSGIGCELGWKADKTAKAFAEPLAKGMLWIDESASCLILPNFTRHNPPENPNVITGWAAMFELIPECNIRGLLFQKVLEYVESLSESFRKAFESASKGLGEEFRKPEPEPEPFPEPEPDLGDYATSAKPKRRTKAPDVFPVTEELKAWARENGVTVDLIRETEKFLDHHRGKGSMQLDWTATWRTWMRNAVWYATARSAGRPQAPSKPRPEPTEEERALVREQMRKDGMIR